MSRANCLFFSSFRVVFQLSTRKDALEVLFDRHICVCVCVCVREADIFKGRECTTVTVRKGERRNGQESSDRRETERRWCPIGE